MPNAITCASLVVGLLASVQALVVQDYVEAAWLVILSVLLDKLDGTAARALKATSAIGVQLDSFADFVTFGVAPGALLYAVGSKMHTSGTGLWGGEAGGVILAVLCAGYVLATCLRLAKFNVLADILPAGGPKVFYGLTSTFAGGLVAVAFILAHKYELRGVIEALPIAAFVFGLLMLTNLPLPKLVPRKNLVFNIFQIACIALAYVSGIFRVLPEYMLLVVATYATVGFGWGFIHRKELLAARTFDPYEAPDPPDDDA